MFVEGLQVKLKNFNLHSQHSIKRRGSEIKAGRKREHWLYYADDKFDSRFLEDVAGVFRVLVLYLPLPFFWALFDQQVGYLTSLD